MRFGPKLLIAAGVLAVIGYSVLDLSGPDTQYGVRLKQTRLTRNNTFRVAPTSPLSSEQRTQFDSLRYFAPAAAWATVSATLQRFARPDTIALPMSDGQTEKYLRVARVSFTEPDASSGKPQQLTLFQKAGAPDSTLFVPFTDLTNGHDSYGGGRYLDVPLPAPDADEITLDFNTAYNPYCAYNNKYSCPVPPAENRLTVAVPAGEKSFHD